MPSDVYRKNIRAAGARGTFLREAPPPSDATPPAFVSGRTFKGGGGNYTQVEVTFSEPVAADDFAAGVTVTQDGIPADLIFADVTADPAKVLYLVNSSDPAIAASTWEYDAALGNTRDAAGNALPTTAAQNLTVE